MMLIVMLVPPAGDVAEAVADGALDVAQHKAPEREIGNVMRGEESPHHAFRVGKGGNARYGGKFRTARGNQERRCGAHRMPQRGHPGGVHLGLHTLSAVNVGIDRLRKLVFVAGSAGGLAVVDLSGAHRFADPAVYEAWYGFAHPHPESLASWSRGFRAGASRSP